MKRNKNIDEIIQYNTEEITWNILKESDAVKERDTPGISFWSSVFVLSIDKKQHYIEVQNNLQIVTENV